MKTILRIAGLLYAGVLFYIFFLARRRPHPILFAHNRLINLVPFRSRIAEFSDFPTLQPILREERLINFFGNIFLFCPLPFFVVLIFKIESCKKIIFIALILSICVELTQFILNIGVADIDDVILNTLGAIIGVAMLHKFKKLLPQFYNLLNV